MSIFSFLKDVGHKFLDNGHDGAAALNGEALASKIQQTLAGLNLGVDAPKVTVQDGKAVIEGNAASQEAYEKAILAVGNTQGISQVESKLVTPVATQIPKFYTVKSGDTLSKIAKEEYGNANAYMQIFEANKPMLKDPDAIYPGQQLRIPQDQHKQAA